MKILRSCLVIAASVLAMPNSAFAETCTAQDIAAAIDQSGARLRVFNKAVQPKLQERMRRYSELLKSPGDAPEDAALDAIEDSKLEALDAKSGELVLRIDTLGRVADNSAPDCAKRDEIKSLSSDLLNIMKEKTDYMLARLDTKISEAGGSSEAPKQSMATPTVKTRLRENRKSISQLPRSHLPRSQLPRKLERQARSLSKRCPRKK